MRKNLRRALAALFASTSLVACGRASAPGSPSTDLAVSGRPATPGSFGTLAQTVADPDGQSTFARCLSGSRTQRALPSGQRRRFLPSGAARFSKAAPASGQAQPPQQMSRRIHRQTSRPVCFVVPPARRCSCPGACQHHLFLARLRRITASKLVQPPASATSRRSTRRTIPRSFPDDGFWCWTFYASAGGLPGGTSVPSNEIILVLLDPGLPAAPFLSSPAVNGSTVTLSWFSSFSGAPSRRGSFKRPRRPGVHLIWRIFATGECIDDADRYGRQAGNVFRARAWRQQWGRPHPRRCHSSFLACRPAARPHRTSRRTSWRS